MAEIVSTRDPDAETVSYTDALITGLAPDRGLYIPVGAQYPQVTENDMAVLPGLSYIGVANLIKGKLIDGDISAYDQREMNIAAYDHRAFPGAEDGEIAGVQHVGPNLFTFDLSRGPTLAFKDFPLRSLAQEMYYMLDKLDVDLDIVGGTSGDTGVAAMRAFKDAAEGHDRRAGIFMLSSRNGTMTPFQRAQMGLESDEYTHNLTIDGSFDDCQEWVKTLKKDPEFADLSAVNSINWGRITAQVVYQFYAYGEMVRKGHISQGDPIDIVTPTGNVGNVLSSHIARQMGLPIRRSVIATNENDIMHQLVQTGVYAEAEGVHSTSSPSMDISRASNYERLVYELFEGDAGRTRDYMEEFERTGRVALQDYGLDPSAFEELGIASGSSDHAARIRSMREVYGLSGEVIDPHTADAVTVAKDGKPLKRAGLEVPTVCMGTASWVKFESTVREALGFVPERPDPYRGLEERPGADASVFIPSIDALKAYIREHRHRPGSA